LLDDKGNTISLFYGPLNDLHGKHQVHFSFLSSVLSDLKHQKHIIDRNTVISIFSAIISVIAVVTSIYLRV
jgi:hypothetical protein